MGITRAVLGAVAAAGVARLLAPHQTDEVVKGAKRAVAAGAKSAERRMKAVMPKAKKAASKAAAGTRKKVAAKAKTVVRKAAKRPVRKSR
ncbi:MAG: hypothetical protein WDM94_14260 [Bauldia sp.]